MSAPPALAADGRGGRTLGGSRYLLVRPEGTPEERVRRLLQPVCHLIRGILESLAAAVLGRPLAVVETACVAAGAPHCRLVTAAP